MSNSNETNEIACPVCGKSSVREYDICPVCNWENDPNQLWKPTLSGGANEMSLRQAQEAYKNNRPVK